MPGSRLLLSKEGASEPGLAWSEGRFAVRTFESDEEDRRQVLVFSRSVTNVDSAEEAVDTLHV